MISGMQASTINSINDASFESISPRPCSAEDEIHEGYGGHGETADVEDDLYMEGVCYLKTRTDLYKEHWAVLNGNEIFCYRTKGDTKSRVMHCLAGTFVKELPTETCKNTQRSLYPVKIVLPPNKSRVLYFNSQEEQKIWVEILL